MVCRLLVRWAIPLEYERGGAYSQRQQRQVDRLTIKYWRKVDVYWKTKRRKVGEAVEKRYTSQEVLTPRVQTHLSVCWSQLW